MCWQSVEKTFFLKRLEKENFPLVAVIGYAFREGDRQWVASSKKYDYLRIKEWEYLWSNRMATDYL